MMKKLLSAALIAALISGVLGALPAQAVPTVPADPNVVDPVGDANYINDTNVPESGQNNETGDDVGSAADLMAVWFSAGDGFLNAHVQTEAAITASTVPYFFRVYVDPGVGADCLWLQGTNGQANRVEAYASLRLSGDCGNETLTEGAEILFEEGPDGTGIATFRFPQTMHPALADGAKLATPRADVVHYTYVGVAVPGVASIGGVTAPAVDNTVVGTDYIVTSGGDPEPPAVEEPPADDSVKEPAPKLTKKKCMKIKNRKKRKRCLKKLKAQNKKEEPTTEACPAYTPGELGAEAESITVTDENTEEAPLELTIEQEMGGGSDLGLGAYDGSAHTYKNVQVDTAAAEAGLFIRYEFPLGEDHDVFVRYPDGSTAAQAADFNIAPGEGLGTVEGGHSEQEAEQIDGLRTADCGGYTVDLSNYIGEGGEYTVKMWLGEIQNDPTPPEGGARSALALMQETLR